MHWAVRYICVWILAYTSYACPYPSSLQTWLHIKTGKPTQTNKQRQRPSFSGERIDPLSVIVNFFARFALLINLVNLSTVWAVRDSAMRRVRDLWSKVTKLAWVLDNQVVSICQWCHQLVYRFYSERTKMNLLEVDCCLALHIIITNAHMKSQGLSRRSVNCSY